VEETVNRNMFAQPEVMIWISLQESKLQVGRYRSRTNDRERTDEAEREGSSRADKEAVGLTQSSRNHRKRAGETGREESNRADREQRRK
jgi:hypothetical protein